MEILHRNTVGNHAQWPPHDAANKNGDGVPRRPDNRRYGADPRPVPTGCGARRCRSPLSAAGRMRRSPHSGAGSRPPWPEIAAHQVRHAAGLAATPSISRSASQHLHKKMISPLVVLCNSRSADLREVT